MTRNPSGRTVGLVPVRLTAAGAATPCSPASDGLPAVHYNDDVVLEAPVGATVLATLPDGRPQALRFGPAAWGVQFHPETSPEVFGAWLRWDSPDGLTTEQEDAPRRSVTGARRRCGLPGSRSPNASRRSSSRTPCAAVRHPSRPETRLSRTGVASKRRVPHPAVDPAVTENAMSASTSADPRERVVILGAAGRDFHDFNVLFRDDPTLEVVAFTATQIPDIDGRTLPARARRAACTRTASRSSTSRSSTDLIARERVDMVVLRLLRRARTPRSCTSPRVHRRRRRLRLPGARRTMLRRARPVIAVTAVRTGVGKSQTTRYVARLLRDMGLRVVAVRHPMPYGDLAAQACQRFATLRRPRPPRLHHRGARGVRAAHRRRRRRLRRASTTGASCARPRPRPTSCCGTAATTTCRSTCPTCTSCSPTRCARATRRPTTPARRTCGWPTSSSSPSATRRGAEDVEAVEASVRALNPRADGAALRQPGHPRRPARSPPVAGWSSSRTARRSPTAR